MADTKSVNGALALQEQKPRVITIEAAERPQDITLRVAAYARVSSSSDDQLNSFAAQNNYYNTLISSKENWSLVDIYADEGITGTSAEKRGDFQRLLADCRRGLIDRILVKSISRFARNTKECLEVIRELKLLGVSVCFEKEYIDTATMSGEMLTSIFASMAQAESESISGNMRWSYQRRMQNGTFNTCKRPYGYHLVNGKLHIYEPEAKIVRMIFSRFLMGQSSEEIAEQMNVLDIPSRDGYSRWQRSTIRYILRNERYAGQSILQKFYSTDTLPIQKRKNNGERPQYLVTESNPPIVSHEVFDAAKNLIRARAERIHNVSSESSLSKKIYCNNCGSLFRRKLVRGTVYWVCRTHNRTKENCPITQLPEKEFHSAFLRMYFKLSHHGEPILTQMLSQLQAIRNRRMLWSPDIVELNKTISDLSRQNQMLATLKQQGLIDPDIFISQTNELTKQLRSVKLEKERLLSAGGDNTISQTQELIDVLGSGPDFLDTFDAELFGELVDKIIVDSNTQLRFRLKNGLDLVEPIEKAVR